MDALRPVRWREGMFVRPHHFQQFDLFLEAREIALLQSISGFGWGLVRLDLAEDLLATYRIEIRALRAVLPDGTLVDIPGNGRLPSRALDPKSVDLGSPRVVLLGVRRIEERRPLTLEAGPGRGETRFLPIEDEVFDLDVGRESAPIERLEYDVQVFLDSEPTQGYETLPIASLSMTGDPARPLILTPGFAPPSVALSASSTLHGTGRSVVEMLSQRLRLLGQVRGSDNVDDLILYQALAGCLTVMREMVQVGNFHPREVYLEMARLAGALLYRDEGGRSFDVIPKYDHLAPGPVFESLRKLIEELMGKATQKNWLRVPLERPASGDLFKTSLPSDAKRPGTRVFLEVEAVESAPKLRVLLMGAKISSENRIQHLRDNALMGVGNEWQNSPPGELPPNQKATFFRLKIDEGTEWPIVVKTEDLAVFVFNCPSDIAINLILVLPRS
jgi:type VI secretion system protein ImpJ